MDSLPKLLPAESCKTYWTSAKKEHDGGLGDTACGPGVEQPANTSATIKITFVLCRSLRFISISANYMQGNSMWRDTLVCS